VVEVVDESRGAAASSSSLAHAAETISSEMASATATWRIPEL